MASVTVIPAAAVTPSTGRYRVGHCGRVANAASSTTRS